MKKIEDFYSTLHAGIDESGKGDVFGPLVIAGVIVTPKNIPVLKENNIRDSKKISENVIKKLAILIKKACIYDIVIISPKKYNTLYEKIGNINKILGWGHKTVIENLYKKKPFNIAISDKFSKKEHIHINNENIELYQFEKGEKDIAVAAASILARYTFVNFMEQMEKDYKLTFPKGASLKVEQAIIDFLQIYAYDNLKNVAKMHFKTVKKYGNK